LGTADLTDATACRAMRPTAGALGPWRHNDRARHSDDMAPRFEWSSLGVVWGMALIAVGLTAWQVRVDQSVFARFFGPLDPTTTMIGAVVVGAFAMGHLQRTSTFAVIGPGTSRAGFAVVAISVPLLAAAAIAADTILRFPVDMNVALPDALRFYPAIAVFVESAFHVIPLTALVAVLGAPRAIDWTFWRIAVPVAAIEAVLQAAYATSFGTQAFSAVHLLVFGVVQVWIFWRFGFVWMLGFRLAYYLLWHIGWGVARLEVFF